ncbi:MAG: mechanosensitive ion channel family protein [Firmicutes bacterium]|nr:mechanosensitive ion channel family protein [Bacillota bacterium]
MDSIRTFMFNTFSDLGFLETISTLLSSMIMVLIYIIIGILVIFIVKQVLHKLFKVKQRGPRAITIGKLLSSLSKYMIWFIMGIVILGELSVDITPFIASAGVIGLAIGFGAQEIVRDFITGFFIIFEEEFNVDDVIQVDGFKGRVLELGLRTTKIQNWLGEVKIINNGNIKSVINYSKRNSTAVVDFGVAYDTDLVQFQLHMNEFVTTLQPKYPTISELPKFLGVTELASSSINMRLIAVTNTMQHYQVERDIRRDLVIFFSERNVTIPFPQIVVHNG